jgi:hypothetical protein
VHGRLDITVVGDLHADLRPLIHVQGRAGDGPVVGQHPQLSAVEVLADRADAQVEPVSLAQPDDARAGNLLESRSLGGEQVVKVIGWRTVHAASGGRGTRAQSESAVPSQH